MSEQWVSTQGLESCSPSSRSSGSYTLWTICILDNAYNDGENSSDLIFRGSISTEDSDYIRYISKKCNGYITNNSNGSNSNIRTSSNGSNDHILAAENDRLWSRGEF